MMYLITKIFMYFVLYYINASSSQSLDRAVLKDQIHFNIFKKLKKIINHKIKINLINFIIFFINLNFI